MNKIRRIPPVCLALSIARLISGRLGYSDQFKGKTVHMEDGGPFTIFRHIRELNIDDHDPVVFIVSFKFSSLSHRANKIVSKLPMLLITGFPGFQEKVYAVNREGYWMGIYQWESEAHLAAYKKSFVFRMMKKRAIPGTVRSIDLPGQKLEAVVVSMQQTSSKKLGR